LRARYLRSAAAAERGKKAAESWQKAAYQRRAFYIDTSGTSQWADLTKYEPNPACYTATIHTGRLRARRLGF
jgi:hypothetical protein